jgi:forespore regulator of the sigma-K checkpoint
VPRFRILKELKKSLKRKRRIAWTLGAGVALFLLSAWVGVWFAQRVITQRLSEPQVLSVEASVSLAVDNPATDDIQDLSMRDQTLHALSRWNGPIEIVLHRTYLCGEETRLLGRHPTSVAAELLRSHRDWGAGFDSRGVLVMEQAIDDLSPHCRRTAYIAMDKTGLLSLYDGLPQRDKVIRTFFQLDVERLETQISPDRMHELSNGIRISDKEEYDSVLSSFTDYVRLKS